MELQALNKHGLEAGVQRVNTVIADVIREYCGAPRAEAPAAPAAPPAAEQIVVPLTAAASSAPPPAWGRPATAPPAQQAAAGAAGEDCRICMAEVLADVRFEPCGHYACPGCVVDLRRSAIFRTSAGVPCPFCRQTIVRYDAPEGVNIGAQVRLHKSA